MSTQTEARLSWPEKVLVGGAGSLSVYEAERSDDFYLLIEDDAAGDALICFTTTEERRLYALRRELPLFQSRCDALEHLTARLKTRAAEIPDELDLTAYPLGMEYPEAVSPKLVIRLAIDGDGPARYLAPPYQPGDERPERDGVCGLHLTLQDMTTREITYQVTADHGEALTWLLWSARRTPLDVREIRYWQLEELELASAREARQGAANERLRLLLAGSTVDSADNSADNSV